MAKDRLEWDFATLVYAVIVHGQHTIMLSALRTKNLEARRHRSS